MEGFLDGFLYLIITVVILVFSMRKKKPVHAEAGNEKRRDDPFGDIFGEIDEASSEGEEENPYYDTVKTLNKESTERPTPWVSESEAKKMVIDADAIMQEASDNNPIAHFEGEVEDDDAYGLKNGQEGGVAFDLKKAVVYSEILTRKAF